MFDVKERPVTAPNKAPEAPKIKNAGTVGWLQQAIHRGRNEMFSEIKTVTPGLAEVILSNNPDNRHIRNAKYYQLVSDMREGRFQSMNGETIIIAKTGELNDGQHRLRALVEAGVCLPMMFVFGVERETRTTLDQGAGRTVGDFIGMGGAANGAVMGSMARMLLSYERSNKQMLGATSRITPSEILERVSKDITLPTSATYGMRHATRMRRLLTPSIIAFCHNVLLSECTTEGLAFMEQLCLGEGLTRDDPAFRAREKLINIGRSSTATKIEIVFRAYNAYREKRTMRTIPVHGRLPELV